MGLPAPLRLLAPLLGLVAAALGSTVRVDWSRPHSDPARRAHLGAAPVIEPVWTRQNIWLPWMRWDPAKPATLPVFEPHVREAALVMATGARPDGPFSVPDLYRDSAGIPRPFDPGHPFVRSLAILKARGITPHIDIGPVPADLSPGRRTRPGPFEWNVAGPVDAGKHYRYVRDLFSWLQAPGRFTREEMSRWGYQLLREPDNMDSWNPRGAGRHADPGNLEEYLRLYDCTLAALRDAGVEAPLSPGNLMIPHPGSAGAADAWTAPLLAALGSGANRCPERLRLPRFRPGKDTLVLGFSAYGGPGTQLGEDPRALAGVVDRLRYAASRHVPGVPLRLVVAEGNLMGKTLLNRSDGTARGAAWAAAVYKIAQDEGLHRYQTWGFVSADHISRFMEHGGLPSAPYNVAALFERMRGERRMRAAVRRDLLVRPGSYLDALVSRSDTALHLLVFRYDEDRESKGREEVDVRAEGLEAGRAYSVRHFRVDASHSSYLEAWQKDMAARGLSVPAPDDACMEFQFGPAHRAAWEAGKEGYRRLARLSGMKGDSLSRATADSAGRLSKRIRMEANSVSLLELRPLAERPVRAP